MMIKTTRDDHRIAWLTALAMTIHIIESAFPNPLPGVKPGLANMVTIIVLIKFGWKMAAWVNLLRVIAGSLMIGTFLSPTFILSLSGALASITVLTLLRNFPGCGPVGYSVASAMVHTLTQFWVAYELFIHHKGLFQLLPPLMTFALILGIITGLITSKILEHLPENHYQ